MNNKRKANNQTNSKSVKLKENEDKIISELNAAQGSPVNIDGYYKPDEALVYKEMRASETLNAIVNK